MAPETFAEPDDDHAFLACVDRVIADLVEHMAALCCLQYSERWDAYWQQAAG